MAAAKTLELLFGAGGSAAFLYYGSLQEDVFRYASDEGDKFTQMVLWVRGACMCGGLSGLP